jgi:PAS domain S-box-containing protein
MDITERKQAEQAERESEQRFRSVADSSLVMICASGPDQQATFFNKGWLSFTGCAMEQELGHGWAERVHPEDRDRTLAEIAASFEARRYCCVEYRLRRADGEYRWILCNGAPRFEADRRFTGYVGSAIDITDFKRSHEEALALQKLESIGVLAGGIAHDFNNLLGSILAESELLEVDLSVEPALLQGIARIKLVAARAAAIVRELLAYSGEEDTVFKPVDISALIAEMVEFLRISISKRATLEVDLPRNLAAVRANPAQIWQVVLNLVTNASEALGERGGKITLTTAPAADHWGGVPDRKADDLPEGDYVRLEVTDTGCGMTEEVRARIFDPFFTTKFSGRGLGLAVVQGIIRRHSGAIRVASTPGQGSRFEVLLPAILEPAVEAGDLAGGRSDSQAADRLGAVLLVEDETSLRVPVAKMLQKRGYSVIEAGNGLAAIEIFHTRAPEIGVVLLDMTLPGASGTEVLHELRGLQPQMKVILTTAYSQEKARIDLGGEQYWGFIRKPYRIDDLVNLLQRALLEQGSAA